MNSTRKNKSCVFSTPDFYKTCLIVKEDIGEASVEVGSLLMRNDPDGAKVPSTEVPAFFGDKQSIQIYARAKNDATTYYRVKKQPRLLLLTPQTIIQLHERAKTKEDRQTLIAYMSPPINDKTTHSPSFDPEKDSVIQPIGFVTRQNLLDYKEKGMGLYINRRVANIVCGLGYDGWVAMPDVLYQYIPSRNAIVPYPPEIMLCKWDSFLEHTQMPAPLNPSDYVALDCEMVGVGRKGTVSRLGEVAIVDWNGNTIYHSYVKPEEEVVDYRTRFSGLTKELLEKGRPFALVQKEVLDVIKGRIVVGHALENDFRALHITYMPEFTRNTARIPMFQQTNRTGKRMPRRLQAIASDFLGETIQEGEHDPAEDARTAMKLYKRYKSDFDQTGGFRHKKTQTRKK